MEPARRDLTELVLFVLIATRMMVKPNWLVMPTIVAAKAAAEVRKRA